MFISIYQLTINYFFLILARRKQIEIKVGDIVKAIFLDNMYRAKILKKVDHNRFYISFIDFGNDETVYADEIFELPEELKKVIIFYNLMLLYW